MDITWSDVGARIREARGARRLDQATLAQRLGVERSAVAKVESGVRRLSALELAAVSDALDVPMGWIVREPESTVVFRRHAAPGDGGQEGGTFDLDLALEEYTHDVVQIRDAGLLPSPQVRHPGRAAVDAQDGVEAARQMRRSLGLHEEPISGLADILAGCGLWLWSLDVPGEGASVPLDITTGVAVVSSRAEPGRRRFTAAHALGHHVLADAFQAGPGVAASRTERERVIDAFAQELLLPERRVAAVLRAGSEGRRADLIRLAVEYRVSWSMVSRIATRLAPGANWGMRPTRAELIRTVGRVPEPDLVEGTTAVAWQRAVLRAHQEDLVTADRAVEMLRGSWTAEDLA